MYMQVKERALALGAKYDISTPSGPLVAARKVFSLRTNITIKSGETPVGNIARTSFFKFAYALTTPSGGSVEFHRESILKDTWVGTGGGKTYHFYSHKGMNFSIFEDDHQIASIVKDRVSIGSGMTYNLQINSDADPILIASMILALNSEKGDKNKKLVNVDIGKIGPEDRPFDHTWQPR